MVIEAFLEGEEASLFALCDGKTVIPFGTAQDHKRVGERDTGPNTGGMGAYSPARVLTPELEDEAMERIVRPTVVALAEAGTPYRGVLYAGLMLTDEGPQLIEYNVRFGDPECQVLMARLESDLVEAMLACAEGRLAEWGAARFADRVALTVVMAAEGYPGTARKGGAIDLSAVPDDALVFHAGTAVRGDSLVAERRPRAQRNRDRHKRARRAGRRLWRGRRDLLSGRVLPAGYWLARGGAGGLNRHHRCPR